MPEIKLAEDIIQAQSYKAVKNYAMFIVLAEQDIHFLSQTGRLFIACDSLKQVDIIINRDIEPVVKKDKKIESDDQKDKKAGCQIDERLGIKWIFTSSKKNFKVNIFMVND